MAGVRTDFFSDVCADFETLLRELNVNLPDTSGETHVNSKAGLLATEFYHQVRRRIPRTPHEVLWSKELRARALPVEQAEVVDRVANELRVGDDLTPRLSTSIRRSVRETVAAKTYDGLLTDWGIHHLHLGETVQADGFVTRTKSLLFVFIKQGKAHLVDVLEHGGSFVDHRLFQILHDNWPDAIAEWRMPGVESGSLSPSYDAAFARRLRSKVTMGTEANDGTPYLPLGGGVALSGHSFEAGMQADRLLNLVHPAQEWVRANHGDLRRRIERRLGMSPDMLRLHFDTRNTMKCGYAVVTEDETRTRFHLKL